MHDTGRAGISRGCPAADARVGTVHRADRAAIAVCLAAAPAVLAGIELFHPGGFTEHPGMYEALSHPADGSADLHAWAYPGPEWWFTLHMVQAPLLGLVALGLWLVAGRLGGSGGWAGLAWSWAWSWLARAAVFVFAVCYTAADAIAGIGLGRLMQIVRHRQADGTLTPSQVEGFRLVLDQFWTDPWVGGIGSVLGEAGSWAVLVAATSLAAGLAGRGPAGWVAAIALVAFGWELHVSHANPHGPVAFAFLIAASAALLRQRRQP